MIIIQGFLFSLRIKNMCFTSNYFLIKKSLKLIIIRLLLSLPVNTFVSVKFLARIYNVII